MMATPPVQFDATVYCSAELTAGLQNQLICLSVFNIVIAITAIVGNVLFLIALHLETSLHRPSKVLLRSLAASDLCVGIIESVFATHYIILAHKQLQMCQYLYLVYSFTAPCLFGLSLLTTTAISVDRLLALLLRLRYRQVVSLKRVYVAAIALWIYAAVVVPIWYYGGTPWGESFIVTNILVCLITSIYCYTRIFVKLRRHEIQVRGNAQQQASQTFPLNITRYRKTVSSAMWVQLTLILCYLPYVVVSQRAYSEIQKRHSSAFYFAFHVTVTLIFFNSSLNPFLYCWKIKEVRRAVTDTLRQMLRLNNQ